MISSNKSKISTDPKPVGSRSSREVELENLFTELTNKYSSLSSHDPLRVRILTVAPLSWSINKIAKEFQTSKRMARKAKKLKKEGGTLAETILKNRQRLPTSIIEEVDGFFNNDLNGRILGGQKNVVSEIIDGERRSVPKRLMFLDLRGLYIKFIDDFPNDKIGFSTFCKLRPKHCVLIGSSGTHCVCVCIIHENCKLMLEALDIQSLTKASNSPINDYKDCIKQIICKEPTSSCYLDECKLCPGITALSTDLKRLLEAATVSDVEFSAWTATDRAALITRTISSNDFVDELCEKIENLKPHSFIAKQQSIYLEGAKSNLSKNEILILWDFSENFAYKVQNASQTFHYNNDQCTVFTVVYYYKEKNELKHKSLIFLSEVLKHDTAAVFTIQSILINDHLKKKFKKIKLIRYYSDGAKQHFKNRFQMVNLINHEDDFGIKAEWHFHATAHGKNACDGIGATFKREAARASLLATSKNAILSAKALYDWGKKFSMKSKTEVFQYTQQEYNKYTRKLNLRFKEAAAVPDIQKNHAFLILPNGKFLTKRYSNATTGMEYDLINE